MALHRITKTPNLVALPAYTPSPTARLFHASSRSMRGVMGPVGSGKSVMCVMELFSRALEQAPDDNGVRRTRFVLVRNTFPQLTTTTLKTVMDWIPPGVMNYSLSSPICGILDHKLTDGTTVHSEWYFIAMDTDADVGRLKSLDCTMVWINEASEIPKSVLDIADSRHGRYPRGLGVTPTYHGLIFDTNPPDDSHWIYDLAEKKKPLEFQLFKQPPGLCKIKSGDDFSYVPNDGTHGEGAAENVNNLPGGPEYYLKMVNSGKDPEWIKVYVMGQYGILVSGKPVYPEYNDGIHLAKEPIELLRGVPLVMGWDFGLNASCVFGQLTPRGRLNVLAELTSDNMGVQRFVRELVKPTIKNRFAGMTIIGIGDPAGGQRSQTTEQTCFNILAEEGFNVDPAPTNEFLARREAVSDYLTRMVDGGPAFQINAECDILRRGFMGQYKYRKMKIAGTERFTETPDKNQFSHLQDACQYLSLYYKDTYNMGAAAGEVFRGTRREIKPVSFKAWG